MIDTSDNNSFTAIMQIICLLVRN